MKIDGVPVVDATKPIVIEITPQDVKKGSTKAPGSCAAALACKRQLGVAQVRVHVGRTYVKVGNVWKRYRTSPALRSEIVAFDRGGNFEPGIYKMLPPYNYQKPTGKAQGSETSKNNPKKKHKRRLYHIVTGVRHHGPAKGGKNI